jgi:drug/metabolite transporter (DMT)-like permease
MNTARWAPWAAAVVGVQVGAAIVATRSVVGELGPASLACLRYLLALACLLPFAWAARGPASRIARRDLPAVMLLGVGQFGLLIALLNIGLQRVDAATAALLFASFPLLTLLVAAALGHERLSWRKAIGVVLTLAGVALALGPAGLAGVLPGDAQALASLRWGQAAVLASALCGAVCSVLYRPYLRRYPALPVGVWAMTAAVLFLAVWAGYEGLAARIGAVSGVGWAAIAFIGVSSGAGYFLWLWALRHAPASRVTLFLSLSPVTAALLGAWWLHEALALRLWLALLLVAGGVMVAQERKP